MGGGGGVMLALLLIECERLDAVQIFLKLLMMMMSIQPYLHPDFGSKQSVVSR